MSWAGRRGRFLCRLERALKIPWLFLWVRMGKGWEGCWQEEDGQRLTPLRGTRNTLLLSGSSLKDLSWVSGCRFVAQTYWTSLPVFLQVSWSRTRGRVPADSAGAGPSQELQKCLMGWELSLCSRRAFTCLFLSKTKTKCYGRYR